MGWVYLIAGLIVGAFWLLALAMLVTNFRVWWLSLRVPSHEKLPSGFPFVAGFACAWMVFATLWIARAHFKIDVPWPLAWVLLPLALDMLGLGGMVAGLLGIRPKRPD